MNERSHGLAGSNLDKLAKLSLGIGICVVYRGASSASKMPCAFWSHGFPQLSHGVFMLSGVCA